MGFAEIEANSGTSGLHSTPQHFGSARRRRECERFRLPPTRIDKEVQVGGAISTSWSGPAPINVSAGACRSTTTATVPLERFRLSAHSRLFGSSWRIRSERSVRVRRRWPSIDRSRFSTGRLGGAGEELRTKCRTLGRIRLSRKRNGRLARFGSSAAVGCR
jgi:hypothetical protein